MRIARVLTRLNLGGPARQALAADPLLAGAGHVVRLFAGTPEVGEGDLFDEFAARGLDVVRVPGLGRGISGVGDLRAARFLRRELAAFRPDVVHTHASKAGALGRAAALRLKPRPKTVHTFHGHVLEGYFPGPLEKLLVRHERRLAQRTDRILAVSHHTADDLVRLGVVEESHLHVVPPGAELGELLALPALPIDASLGRRSGALRDLIGAGPESVLVGVLGRLAEVKQPGVALDVFEQLAERYPDLHLVFIGDGPERRALERRLAGGSDALRERAHLVGARSDITDVLADLDCLLLTSRTEGLPVALIEAAAAALPAVATSVGGVPEIVAHERTGFLGEDADELAFGLAQLLDSASLRQAMGHRARLRVEARHSAQALADRLAALYGAVLEESECVS